MTKKRLIALGAPSVLAAVTWVLFAARPSAALIWILGIVLGVAFQRSRFCFAAAIRDSVLFHDTGPAKALLIGLALSTVGFVGLQLQALSAGDPLPGNLYPISAATAVGAFCFGLGSIPVGGCATNTLTRLGEGHKRFLWTLVGLVAGSTLGAFHYGWWEGLLGAIPPVHFPAVVGWPGALALQSLLFLGIYGIIRWWERKGAVQY